MLPQYFITFTKFSHVFTALSANGWSYIHLVGHINNNLFELWWSYAQEFLGRKFSVHKWVWTLNSYTQSSYIPNLQYQVKLSMFRQMLRCRRLRVQTHLWSHIICVPKTLEKNSVGFAWSWNYLNSFIFDLKLNTLWHISRLTDQRSYTHIWLFANYNHNSGLNTGIL